MSFIKSENFENALLYFTVASYLLSCLFYWVGMFTKSDLYQRFALRLTVVGFLGNSGIIALRLYKASSLSLVDNSDFLLTFTCFAVVSELVIIWRYKLKVAGSIITTLVFMLFVYLLAIIEPVSPYLSHNILYSSNWLLGYLFTTAVAYGALLVAFGLCLMYLLKSYLAKTNPRGIFTHSLPSLEVLEELSYKFISYGFPVFSLSILLGGIWTHNLQGRYWAWTPKETWSFISWLAYAAYFHSRRLHGWRGARAAWMAVMSFMAILFTFFGVTNFLPGQF